MAEDKVEDKKEEIWGVEQEEKLIQRLIVYGKGLESGGVLWTEEQVDFLKLLVGEEAFNKAVELYNAPPKDDPNVAQVLPNMTIRFLGDEEESK